MKLAIVVQRYGPAAVDDAERHARYLAEHLAEHATVEVLTTCARSDVTWANELPAGIDTVGGILVRRFPVARAANRNRFARLCRRVFSETHSIADELRWLRASAPVSRSLLGYLRKHRAAYDFGVFVDYRHGHSYYGGLTLSDRAVLVPHAACDPSIGLKIFSQLFRSVRGMLFDSPEEQTLVHAIASNQTVPNVVGGAGVDVPHSPQPSQFRHKHNIRGPFAIVASRVDAPQCQRLTDVFNQYLAEHRAGGLSLVVAGDDAMPLPAHQKIRCIAGVTEPDRLDAIAGAEVVIVPSESQHFSRTALEAWALGKPVLVNGASKGLFGQVVRSNGGLCYRSDDEFVAMLTALEQNRWLCGSLGKSGRQYVRDHCDWRLVGRKYHEMFQQLQASRDATRGTARRGWLNRLRREVAPSADVVRGLA